MESYNCFSCGFSNPIAHTHCAKCKKSAAAAAFISNGTGSFPEGFIWPLFPRALVLGAAPADDILIPTNKIHDQHCRFDYVKGVFYITLPKNSPTAFIGGQSIRPNMKQALNNGSTLKIGDEELTITYFNGTETFSEVQNFQLKQLAEKSVNPTVCRLLHIIAFKREVINLTNSTDIYSFAVDTILRITDLDRAYAFQVITEGDELKVKEVIAKDSDLSIIEEEEFSISRSIMTQVLENQGAVFIQDADKEVTSTVSMANFNIKTVICLPLTVKNEQGERELIGIIYADKTLSTTPLPSGISASLQSLRKITSHHLVRTMQNDEANSDLNSFKHYFTNLKDEMDKIRNYLDDTSQHIVVGTSTDTSVFQERITECNEALKMLAENVKQNF
ncbi:FHA domain-containing protein [Lentisphaera profundi]|uniref:FHA domain-containing protein n=1 Tax=Lentisphaera profundi TaxID=1658616 RepID=A0ABY7VTA1_9BACT|nr:FHA domain-containing protein [Lentisphaera profundi]WDE95368.1 FHA domain-containing protein [Lentisphaera profundi]